VQPVKKGKLYYCPYDCGDKRFPKPKWKTEKGAIKHVNNCAMQPEKVEEREAIEEKRLSDQAEKDRITLLEAKHKIGETISFIHERVIKPTHEQRFNRMVKVRYEAECTYTARTATIKSISIVQGAVCYNGYIYNRDIRDDFFSEIEKEAAKMRVDHLAWLKTCSDLR